MCGPANGLTFHPSPSWQKFHETWEDDGWKQRSGVNVWNMLTVDAKRGIAYLPFGADLRPLWRRSQGANLFSDSLRRWMQTRKISLAPGPHRHLGL
jgi:glucose dehydrogenase